MAESRWMYARGQQQFGPVTLDQMKQLMSTGQVQGADLVWTDGMAQWLPAQSVSQLRGDDAGPPIASAVQMAQPTIPSTGAAVPYYSAGGLPPRALERLKGHARPTGDVGDWPLDDHHVSAYAETARLRRRVVRTANTYRALMALTIIGTAIVLFGLLVVLAGLGGSRRGGGTSVGPGGSSWLPAMSGGITLALGVGFSVLYGLAARGTMRSQRWAPLTIAIVWLAQIGLNIVTVALSAIGARSRSPEFAIVSLVCILLFGVAVITYSLRAFFAIPKYLAQPAWCQELIVRSEVDKKSK